MTFLNPLFLGAAGAAVIPLILHLMARRKTLRLPFSTIRFLKLAQRQSSTKMRMENLLLWLLRTLMLLLLAFAFAGPVSRLSGRDTFGSLLGASRRDVAIVWDGSYSMSYEINGQSVWDTSKETILSIIHGLNKGDRVSIFIAADGVIPLIGEPTSDLDFAAATVKAQQYRFTPSSLSDAALAALDTLANAGNEREFYIVTDGQSSAWDGFRAAEKSQTIIPARVDKSIPTFISLLGAKDPVNTAPIAVQVQPPLIMTDTSPELLVTIGHTGPAQQTSVALFVDDREVVRRSVDLPANGGYNLIFNIPPMTGGMHAIRIRTADDALMADNDYLLLLKVREDLPVLVAGPKDDAFFIEHALAPSDSAPVKAKLIAPDLLASETLDDFPCVFLVNALPLPGQAIAALQDYVHRGGVVAIFPGDRATPEDYNAFTFLPAKVQRVTDDTGASGRDPLVLLDPLDPLFAGLKMPPGVSPSTAIQRRLAFDPLEPGAKALIGASSERPLLLSRAFGTGRVLLFSVSADRQWSDLPLSPFFLPIIHQTVRLACGIGADRVQVQPASPFVLSDVISQAPDGAVLIDPDHTPLPIRKIQKTGREGDFALVVDHVDKPGYYFLSGPAGAEPLMAVNLDRSESDLKPISPDEIPPLTGLKNVSISTTPDELLRQVQEHRVGRPLSEVTLWAVLLLSMLELAMANRACRRRATLSESITINPSGRVLGKAA